MKQSFLNKRIPTVFGLFLLVITLFTTSYVVQTGVLFPIRATNSDQPVNVRISNISDTSFTVFYTTVEATTGSLTYGPTETYGNVAGDVRDQNAPQNHTAHYITVTNLQPKTQYMFAVVSGGTTYTDNGKPYTVTTGDTIQNTTSDSKSFSGKVVLSDGSAPKEAIIFAQTDESQLVSSFINESGSYTLSVSPIRNKALSAYLPIADKTFHITILGDNQQSELDANIQTSESLPTLTLSQTYDFAADTAITPVASESAGSEGFPVFSGNKPVNTNPQILSPKKDQSFSDQQPEFTGVAPPNRSIEILIESNHEIKATIRTDRDGKWSYRPKQPLEPGKHTITITTRDEAGILRTVIQSFIVNAQGSQFTEPSVSPPSPSPSPTATKTPTPIVTVAISPSASPTLVPTGITPGVTVTVTTTATPSPTIPIITRQPTIPLPPPPTTSPGSEGVLITLGLASVAIIAGAVLFFLTGGLPL